jgi:hypothetical protein
MHTLYGVPNFMENVQNHTVTESESRMWVTVLLHMCTRGECAGCNK